MDVRGNFLLFLLELEVKPNFSLYFNKFCFLRMVIRVISVLTKYRFKTIVYIWFYLLWWFYLKTTVHSAPGGRFYFDDTQSHKVLSALDMKEFSLMKFSIQNHLYCLGFWNNWNWFLLKTFLIAHFGDFLWILSTLETILLFFENQWIWLVPHKCAKIRYYHGYTEILPEPLTP